MTVTFIFSTHFSVSCLHSFFNYEFHYDKALYYWDKAIEIDNTFLAAKYSKIFYYEETGDYKTAYKNWCDVIEELKKAGHDIEAAADEKLAQACLEKINK